MVKNAAKRNSGIIKVTTALFAKARKEHSVISDSYLPKELRAYVSPLINQKALGFREIVLTVIIARLYGIKFDPTTDFYKCNPRAVYEHGIRYVLEKLQIPCGKSGPLNVAKNQNALNQEWARGRRPEAAAQAAVAFMNTLKPGILSKDNLEKMGLVMA